MSETVKKKKIETDEFLETDLINNNIICYNMRVIRISQIIVYVKYYMSK